MSIKGGIVYWKDKDRNINWKVIGIILGMVLLFVVWEG